MSETITLIGGKINATVDAISIPGYVNYYHKLAVTADKKLMGQQLAAVGFEVLEYDRGSHRPFLDDVVSIQLMYRRSSEEEKEGEKR